MDHERMDDQRMSQQSKNQIAAYCKVDASPESVTQRRAVIGFVVAVVLTCFVSVAFWYSARLSSTEADMVVHTSEVMTWLTESAKDAIDAETGARGYSLTGQDPFLEPYTAAREKLPEDLATLERLVRDNPEQEQRAERLKLQVDAAIEVATQIVLDQRTRHKAADLQLLRAGKTRVDAVRATVQEMQGEESRLLAERSEKTRRSRRLTRVIAVLGILVGLGVLSLTWFSLRRQIELGGLARTQANRFNAELEQRVTERTTELEAINRSLEKEIQARADAEQELRESKERLTGVIGSAMDAIITVDDEQRVVLFNAAAEKMFGSPAAEAVGASIERFLPERFRARHREHIQQFGETGTTSRVMGTLGAIWGVRTSGEEFPIEASISQLETAGKKLFTVILRDITERRQSEELLREQAQVLSQAQVLVLDLQRRIVLWPRGAERLYGFSSQEALGAVSHDLFHSQFPEPLETIEKKLFETGTWDGELIHRKRDGSVAIVASAWVLHRNDEGKPTRILETNTDITARKEAEERLAGQTEELARQSEELARSEQALRKLNDELEHRVNVRTTELQAANKELEAFTYSVSHDLRAPLRHINGFTRILAEDFGTSLPEEAQQHLKRIEQGTNRMGRLVDELLSLTRVGRQSLALQVTGLDSIVREVIAMLESEIEGRKVEWKIAKLPFVECDPTLIRQVFQNLISNALKYSRPRSISVIEIGQTESNGQPSVFVRDNGVGFSMKYADKLFGVFQRLHRAEDFEGTGVGLATVHRIIQKHGGRIWAESELDGGATFYFTLAHDDRAEAKNTAAVAGGKI
jgi:PAS domain S-box-containing protein